MFCKRRVEVGAAVKARILRGGELKKVEHPPPPSDLRAGMGGAPCGRLRWRAKSALLSPGSAGCGGTVTAYGGVCLIT